MVKILILALAVLREGNNAYQDRMTTNLCGMGRSGNNHVQVVVVAC